ncbi:uncharacterized protein EV154DRAFT_560345 [Mucor mucedo]|uniref:uncharacterized protein n=1 Tax=Mucor mucedo TaxID=29922 RepID=UPI00221E5868|nr:uncharacterized protein EV154DRAFT_560345 [Mucor mucedo]KAI7894392.1 hypothetical protein EV154DRAFT_560345 [Mucor mucedo]
MDIETITSPKTYRKSYLNVCPSDEAGLLKYSSTTSAPRLTTKVAVKAVPSSMMHISNSSPKSHQETDLQSVVSKYHANPELLKLILASKVEEDKRRTEEAKLKAKEIDLYFQQQQEKDETNRKSLIYPKEPQEERRRRSSCSSTSSNGSTANTTGAVDSIHRRIAPYSIPRPIAVSDNSHRRHSSISTALVSINRLSINNSNNNKNQQKIAIASSAPSPSSQYLYPPSNGIRISPDTKITPPVIKASRRRRSMQAITKIVETVEYPYDDGHFWKNNGNTVQKKTGCKSVYYKCANSCKGCPVNKTVVEQLNGSYMIKYRGDHVAECSQVEHIRDL